MCGVCACVVCLSVCLRLMQDCVYMQTQVEFAIGSATGPAPLVERFSAQGSTLLLVVMNCCAANKVINPGFTGIFHWLELEEQITFEFKQGQEVVCRFS